MIRMIIRIRRLQTYKRRKINSNTQYKKQVPESWKVQIQYFVISLQNFEQETYSMFWPRKNNL